MTELDFIKTYCHECGTQRCEGPGSPWFEGCEYNEQLDGYILSEEAIKLREINHIIEERFRHNK